MNNQIINDFVKLYVRGYDFDTIARILNMHVQDVVILYMRVTCPELRNLRRITPDFIEPIY